MIHGFLIAMALAAIPAAFLVLASVDSSPHCPTTPGLLWSPTEDEMAGER